MRRPRRAETAPRRRRRRRAPRRPAREREVELAATATRVPPRRGRCHRREPAREDHAPRVEQAAEDARDDASTPPRAGRAALRRRSPSRASASTVLPSAAAVQESARRRSAARHRRSRRPPVPTGGAEAEAARRRRRRGRDRRRPSRRHRRARRAAGCRRRRRRRRGARRRAATTKSRSRRRHPTRPRRPRRARRRSPPERAAPTPRRAPMKSGIHATPEPVTVRRRYPGRVDRRRNTDAERDHVRASQAGGSERAVTAPWPQARGAVGASSGRGRGCVRTSDGLAAQVGDRRDQVARPASIPTTTHRVGSQFEATRGSALAGSRRRRGRWEARAAGRGARARRYVDRRRAGQSDARHRVAGREVVGIPRIARGRREVRATHGGGEVPEITSVTGIDLSLRTRHYGSTPS